MPRCTHSRCTRRTPPAAGTDLLHPEDPFASGQRLAPHPLQLPPAHDRSHCAVLARHGPRQRRFRAAGRGALKAPAVLCGRGGQASASLSGRRVALRIFAEEQLLILRKAGKRKKRDAQPDLLHAPTALGERLPLARIARIPRGLSRRCSPSRTRRTSPGPKSSHLHPGSAGLQRPGPPGEDWDRPFAGLH